MLTRSKARQTGQRPPPIFGHNRPEIDCGSRKRARTIKESIEKELESPVCSTDQSISSRKLPALPPMSYHDSGLNLHLTPISYPNPANIQQLGISLCQALLVPQHCSDQLIQVYLFLSNMVTSQQPGTINGLSLNQPELKCLSDNLASSLADLLYWCLAKSPMSLVYKKKVLQSGKLHIGNLIGPMLVNLPTSSSNYPEFHYLCRILVWFNRPNPKISPLFIFTWYDPATIAHLQHSLTGPDYAALETGLINRVDTNLVGPTSRSIYQELLQQSGKYINLYQLDDKGLDRLMTSLYGSKNDKLSRLDRVLLLYSRRVTGMEKLDPSYFDWDDPVTNTNPTTIIPGYPCIGYDELYWFAPLPSTSTHNPYLDAKFNRIIKTIDPLIEIIRLHLEQVQPSTTGRLIIDQSILPNLWLSWPQLVALCYHLDRLDDPASYTNNIIADSNDPPSDQRCAILTRIIADKPLVPANILYLLYRFPIPILQYMAYQLYNRTALLYNRFELIELLSRNRLSDTSVWTQQHDQVLQQYHWLPIDLVKKLVIKISHIQQPPQWLRLITGPITMKGLLQLFQLIPPIFGSDINYIAHFLGSNYSDGTKDITDLTMKASGIMFDIESHHDRVNRYRMLSQHPNWVVLTSAINTGRHTSDLLEDMTQSSYTIEFNDDEYPMVTFGYGTIGNFFPITLTEIMTQIRAILNREAITPIVWPKEPRNDTFTTLITYQLVVFLVERQKYYNSISVPEVRKIFKIYFDAVNLTDTYLQRLQINGDEVVRSYFNFLNSTQQQHIKKLLEQVIRVGWRFRQWDGISPALPLLTKDTTKLTVTQVMEQSAQDTTHLMELIGQLDPGQQLLFKSLICYDMLSDRWVQGQLETLDRLISQLFTPRQDELVCIRLGSNLLLYTGKYYLKLLFQVEVDLTGLERIS